MTSEEGSTLLFLTTWAQGRPQSQPKMKRIPLLLAIIALLFSSCTSKNDIIAIVHDDIAKTLSSKSGEDYLDILGLVCIPATTIVYREHNNPCCNKESIDAAGRFIMTRSKQDGEHLVECVWDALEKRNPVWAVYISYNYPRGGTKEESLFYLLDRKSKTIIAKYPLSVYREREKVILSIMENASSFAEQ